MSTKSESTPPIRKGMQLLGRMVERGELAPEAMVDTLAWARKMRDNPTASERVRMRAAELMVKITAQIAASAAHLDKMERAEPGDATERDESPMEKLLRGTAG